MSKHTPTPWELAVKDDKYGQELLIVKDYDAGQPEPMSQVICGAITDPDDAEFIVRACNAHEVLASSIYRVNIRVESGLKSGQINGAGEATLRAIASDIYFALVTLQGLAKARGEA